MQNLPDIVVLLPDTYSKKLTKLHHHKENWNNFYELLQRKLDEWNLSFVFEQRNKKAYKLSYSEFENVFLAEFNLILYIVCSSSVESFRKSIKRLICTCENRDRLNHVVTVSLGVKNFQELHECSIDVVHFGEDTEQYANISHWTELEDTLRTKLRNRNDNNSVQSNNHSLTLPIQIPQPKSPSKLRRLFNNLPLKIHDTKESHKNKKSDPTVVTPHINVEESETASISPNNEHKNTELPIKNCHSKFSFHSLLKKRSHKTKDTGSSMDCRLSSCSDSKDSDTLGPDKSKSLDVSFDIISNVSQCSEKPSFFCTSSLEKPKNHKFWSKKCVENKPKKIHEDAFGGLGLVSAFLMKTTSDIIVADSNAGNTSVDDTSSLCRQRCESEPPFASMESNNNSPVNERIKFYSWNEDLIQIEESKLYDLTFNKLTIREITLEATLHDLPYQTVTTNNNTDLYVDEDVFLFREINKNETNLTEFDRGYFQIQYASNDGNQSVPTMKHIVNSDVGNLNRLCIIADDIQQEYQVSKRQAKPNSTMMMSFKTGNGSEKRNIENKSEIIIQKEHLEDCRKAVSNVLKNADEKSDVKISDSVKRNRDLNGMINPRKTISESIQLKEQSSPLYSLGEFSDLQQVSNLTVTPESTISTAQSYLFRTGQYLTSNPIFVGGIFTVTALTAPLWSTYIPHDLHIGQFLLDTVNHVLTNEMVQYIPNQLISTARDNTISSVGL